MSKRSIIIVEDENIVAKDIQNAVKKLGHSVSGICSSADDAITMTEKYLPDLVIMDVKLKGSATGIEAASEIRSRFDIPVIFLTAFADQKTFEKAKVTEPYAYISKPFREEELHSAIELGLYRKEKEHERKEEQKLVVPGSGTKGAKGIVFVKSNSNLIKLRTADIYLVEADKDYVELRTQKESFRLHTTMSKIAVQLPSNEFVRIHRGTIVNMNRIKHIEQKNLHLDDFKKSFPIGTLYRKELLRKVNLIR